MASQIFKNNICVNINILYDLLEKICIKTDKYYIFDINSFKKMKYFNYHVPFIYSIIPFYRKSKRFYAERPLLYNSFTNIIRQICKHNNITINSLQKFDKSDYTIEFYIYIDK